MGTNIHGSIEVRGVYQHQETRDLWTYFADLGIAFSRNAGIYDSLFGVYDNERQRKIGDFTNRGLPSDVDELTEKSHANTAAGQKNGTTHHDTWFLWSEFEQLQPSDIFDIKIWCDRNWAAVFNVCTALSATYGAENVRIVVWFEG